MMGISKVQGSDMSGAGRAFKVLSAYIDIVLDEVIILLEAHGGQDGAVVGGGGKVGRLQVEEQLP